MKLLLKVNSEKTRKRHQATNNNWRKLEIKSIKQTNNSQSSTNLVQKLSTNGIVIVILLLVIVVSVGVAVYLALGNKEKGTTKLPRQILFGNDYETGTFPNLGNGHLVIDREQWGASDKRGELHELDHPIPYVLITHVGVQASPCTTVYRCSIKMRTYQDSAIAEKHLPDVNSNFYVGNDGNIYVGRGWNFSNTYANNTLAVTFMGDYVRHQTDEKQLEAVQYLLAYGVTNKYLALDYKLVAQNQTKTTHSPGAYVYREIVKWPHWYACGEKDNPDCGEEIDMPKIWDAKQ